MKVFKNIGFCQFVVTFVSFSFVTGLREKPEGPSILAVMFEMHTYTSNGPGVY